LTTKLPQAKVQTLKDVGHWHQLEDVDATAAALKAFVQG
jgi:pimeloyl-ACP methyl ester carboxylesterase